MFFYIHISPRKINHAFPVLCLCLDNLYTCTSMLYTCILMQLILFVISMQFLIFSSICVFLISTLLAERFTMISLLGLTFITVTGHIANHNSHDPHVMCFRRDESRIFLVTFPSTWKFPDPSDRLVRCPLRRMTRAELVV